MTDDVEARVEVTADRNDFSKVFTVWKIAYKLRKTLFPPRETYNVLSWRNAETFCKR